MANFISKLFGGGSEKRDTTYTGYRPAPTQAHLQGGPELYKKIMERMSGEGVGFGDEYVSSANPIVANMRNQFTTRDIPELNAELSATGRRRGSGGFQQVSDAYERQRLSENDIMARLVQRNEEQKRSEIGDAFGKLQDYVGTEGNLGTTRANFDYGDFQRTLAEDAARRTAKGNENMRALTTVGGLVSTPFTGGTSMGGSDIYQRLFNRSGFNPKTMSTPPAGYNLGFNPFRNSAKNAQLGRA